MLSVELNRAGLCPVGDTCAEPINLVCAADDAYAMPLAVTLRSVCQNLGAGFRLRLFVLDGGILPHNWKKIEQTLEAQPVDVCRLNPDLRSIADLSVSHHISHTAYLRLLTAELLPEEIRKVIYLDADLLVREDLSRLWLHDMADNYCLASPDIACPYIDARIGCANFRLAAPYMAALRPISNYRELGLNGAAEYFNSGVMVLNLERWRREYVTEGLLKILRDYRRYVWCWDQYALNVLFHQNWGRIAPRWNQGAHVFAYPDAKQAPIAPQEWVAMKTDPAIIHFTTEFKPWQKPSNYPCPAVFYEGLEGTAWRGFKPESLSPSFRRWGNLQWASLMKLLTISSRRIAFAWA